MIGRQLSHFRILDRIGEGGMGVVYRAEDEKLQRVVALKVLPPERLADEERRLRFLREARTAAAVTHPNIAVIHEIDESDGVVFIAMELIEGKTLRAVIGGKPLALREALRLGVGPGVYHMGGGGYCSWLELAREVVQLAGIAVAVEPITTAELGRPAPRPPFSALASERPIPRLPSWPNGVAAAVDRLLALG